MSDEGNGNGILGKIMVAVIVALLVGGSAPWWWQELFKANGPAADGPRPAGFEIALVGPPRFDFLGSGGGVGPPPYRLGRYAFLSDVRIQNHDAARAVVRKVRVTLRRAGRVFAEGEQDLGSLERWKVDPGQTDLVQLQVRTEVLQDQSVFKTRFELPAGRPKPRFELALTGSVTFEILTGPGESVTESFPLERFDAVIEPFGS